ncbi:General substrate transporter [Niveomyces insectorum RCEF 264]|uniref:General substrate transporter n=1 Tax=Niveomyces insectorum RCEF 264 TaxID=1081102 RepID=A0A167MN99_9HYPO|nr:General substrate transporter [Niveomyces insectorum RCEF 264]
MASDDIDYRVINTDNKWKILRIHWRYSWWAIWVSFGTIMQGFDNVCNSTIIGMEAFKRQFGQPDPTGAYYIPARYLGGWQGTMQAGTLIGAFAAGWLMDSPKIGRKRTILLACSVSCVGVGIQYASHNWKVYIVGKLINGLAIGIWFTAAPTWIGENARPECRGLFLCLYNSTIVFGQALVTFVGQGAVRIEGRWSYGLCILLQMMFPAVGFAGYCFFAESPHYLLKMNRVEEAKRALRKIYSSRHQAFLDIELVRLQEEVEFSAALKEAARVNGRNPLWQCWQGANAVRTATAIFISAGQQLMGASFVLGYLTYFLELIGITNSFKFSAGLFVVMLVSTTSAFFLIEVFGRRNILIAPSFILVFILLIIGIMGCIHNKTASGDVIVAMIYLWGAVYQFSVGATGFAVASEVSTLPLRTHTQAYIVATDAFFGWLIGFIVPYLINPHPDGANLGGKVGFVFFGSGLLIAIGFFYLVPDSRGLSFDELDYLYTNKVTPRKFQQALSDRQDQSEGLELVVNGKTLIAQVEHANTKGTVGSKKA